MNIFNSGRSSSVSINNNSVTVNGSTIKVPAGANVSVINGKVFINGEEYKEVGLDGKDESVRAIKLVLVGNVNSVKSNVSVEVKGNCGSIDAGGSVMVTGDVTGNIDAGGSTTVNGNVKGDIDAGGSVICKSRG